MSVSETTGGRRAIRIGSFAFAALALTAVLCAVRASQAGTPPLGAGTQASFKALAAAADLARSGDPDAVQARYDLARDIESALAATTPSARCKSLYDALLADAHGNVTASEGVDRLSSALVARGERAVRDATSAFRTARAFCPGGISGSKTAVQPTNAFVAPASGETFTGTVRLRVPAGARDLEVAFRRKSILRQPAPGTAVVTTAIPSSFVPGRGELTVSFRASGVGRPPERERLVAALECGSSQCSERSVMPPSMRDSPR